MSSKESTSNLCRICGKHSSKLIKSNSEEKETVFEWISEVSNLEIIEDRRLPKYICSICSDKLIESKAVIDILKKTNEKSKEETFFHSLDSCRTCLEPTEGKESIRIDDLKFKKQHGRYLIEIIHQIAQLSAHAKFLSTLWNVCKQCSTQLATYSKLRKQIVQNEVESLKKIGKRCLKRITNSAAPMEEVFLENADLDDIFIEPDTQIEGIEIKEEALEIEDVIKIEEETVTPIVTTQDLDQADPIDLKPTSAVENSSHNPKKFKCQSQNCTEEFFTKVERLHHMRLSGHYIPTTLTTTRQFFCYCGMIFVTKREQVDHLRLSHNVRFKCNSCARVLFNENSCRRHIMDDHKGGFFTVGLLTKSRNNDVDVFRCSICHLDFNDLETYSQHSNSIDHYENSTYYCDPPSENVGESQVHNDDTESKYESLNPEENSKEMSSNKNKKHKNKSQKRKNDEDLKKPTAKKCKTSPNIQNILKVQKSVSNSLKFAKNDPKLRRLKPIVKLERIYLTSTRVNVSEFLGIKSEPFKEEDIFEGIKSEPFDESYRDLTQNCNQIMEIEHEIKTEVEEPSIVVSSHHENPKVPPNTTEYSIIDDTQLLCIICNRLMKTSHFEFHRATKFHEFYKEFPQFRSVKIKRHQKLSENELMSKLKFPCDICNMRVIAKHYKLHLNTTKHKFYVENPSAERKPARKPRTVFVNYEDDLLFEQHDPKKTLAMICDYCRKKFFKKNQLEQHIKRHCDSFYIFKCTFCAEKFYSQTSMMIHRKKNHADEKGCYLCEVCNKKYDRHREYLRHLTSMKHLKMTGQRSEKQPKPRKMKYTCFICNMDFKNFDTYSRHCGTRHVSENEFSTRCYKPKVENSETKCKIDNCKRKFPTPNDLQIHYVMDHDNEVSFKIMSKKLITCHCGKLLTRVQYRLHVENFHPSSTLCHLCGKNFYENVKAFRYHRDYEHLPFLHCDMCSFKVQSKAKLWKHMKYHLTAFRRKYVCEICGNGYRFLSSYEKHKAFQHEGMKSEKIHKCDQCDKAYATTSTLNEHKMYKHDGGQRKLKFTCNICDGRKFPSRSSYNKHLKSMLHQDRERTERFREENVEDTEEILYFETTESL